jgi:hypothetical protein
MGAIANVGADQRCARAIKPRLYLLGTYVAGTAPTPVEIASMGRSSALRGRAYAGPPLHLDFVKTGRSSAYGAGRTLVSLYTCECGVDEEIIAIWRPGRTLVRPHTCEHGGDGEIIGIWRPGVR